MCLLICDLIRLLKSTQIFRHIFWYQVTYIFLKPPHCFTALGLYCRFLPELTPFHHLPGGHLQTPNLAIISALYPCIRCSLCSPQSLTYLDGLSPFTPQLINRFFHIVFHQEYRRPGMNCSHCISPNRHYVLFNCFHYLLSVVLISENQG